MCAAPRYLKANEIPRTPRELTQRSCLHYGYSATGYQWQVLAQNQEERVSVDGVFCANDGEVEGWGIVILPTFLVEQELARGELGILPNYRPSELILCVIDPVNRHLSTKIQVFTQFLQECFA
ncbi:MAG: LysR substrate-binding domain-containing protein [Cyanophyceae cyanobacterium]